MSQVSRETVPFDPLVYARRWRMLAVLALSLVIIGLDNTILNVALPTLQERFDASVSQLQWMVDAYLLVFAGLLLTMGTLGDRFGRKKALLAGLGLFGGASLAVLVVDSSGQLIAVRAAMGAGAALIMPATLSIITNVFPREERGKAIGVWAGMAAVGVGLGPLVGGVLLHWFSWSSVFLVNVPIGAAALLLGIRLVPDSRDPKPGSFEVRGAVVSTAALASLVYGRPDVDANRIGGLGLSVGGEALLQTAAETRDLKAVVSEGAGARVRRHCLHGFQKGAGGRVLRRDDGRNGALFEPAAAAQPEEPCAPSCPNGCLLHLRGARGRRRGQQPRLLQGRARAKADLEDRDLTHARLSARPKEYERRVIGFFDRTLLGG
jgi:hypothetical protein